MENHAYLYDLTSLAVRMLLGLSIIAARECAN